MIIDAHNHPDWLGYDLHRSLANMTSYGIDKTWLLTWEAPADEYGPEDNHEYLSNEWGALPFSRCLYYKQQAPHRFILGYAPDPRRPDSIDRLQAAIELHGVQLYGELKVRMMYDNPDAIRMFHFCGEHGLPVTVHLDYEFDTGSRYPRPNWWYGGGLEAFERAIQACPETAFLGHGPGFWAHISNDGKYDKEPYPTGEVLPGGGVLSMLRRYPNLYADLSAGSAHNALSRDREFAADFLLEFQDRLLFARDSFDDKMQQFLKSMTLPIDVTDKIFAGNALALVPVPDKDASPS